MSTVDRRDLLALRYDTLALSRKPDRLIVYPRGVGPNDLPSRGYRK
jgi:hypothetical protein